MAQLGNSSQKCPRCSKAVYFTEQAIGPGGMYHKACLTCKQCSKGLDSTNLTEREGEPYCKNCYGRLFGPKGYGFGGTLNTETKITALPASTNDAGAIHGSTDKLYSSQGNITKSADKHAANSTSGVPIATSTAVPKFGGSTNCARCSKAVYAVEKVVGPANAIYHKQCFTCKVNEI